MARPGVNCYASPAVNARRHSRRTPAAGMPGQWASPLRSRWRRDAQRGGPQPEPTTSPGMPSRTMAAGPTYGARVTVRRGRRRLGRLSAEAHTSGHSAGWRSPCGAVFAFPADAGYPRCHGSRVVRRASSTSSKRVPPGTAVRSRRSIRQAANTAPMTASLMSLRTPAARRLARSSSLPPAAARGAAHRHTGRAHARAGSGNSPGPAQRQSSAAGTEARARPPGRTPGHDARAAARTRATPDKPIPVTCQPAQARWAAPEPRPQPTSTARPGRGSQPSSSAEISSGEDRDRCHQRQGSVSVLAGHDDSLAPRSPRTTTDRPMACPQARIPFVPAAAPPGSDQLTPPRPPAVTVHIRGRSSATGRRHISAHAE